MSATSAANLAWIPETVPYLSTRASTIARATAEVVRIAAADLAGGEHVPINAERLRLDVEMLCDLVYNGIQVEGDVVKPEPGRWVIYGRSSYDGQIILAQYDNASEASSVFRAIPIANAAGPSDSVRRPGHPDVREAIR